MSDENRDLRQKAPTKEDEFFAREDRERIERLRAQRQHAEQVAGLICPRCQGAMAEETHEGVLIDRCTGCGGVWLDPGELQALTAKAGGGGLLGWLSGKR